jgi:hypothetical protein
MQAFAVKQINNEAMTTMWSIYDAYHTSETTKNHDEGCIIHF